jgi:insulysin
MVEKTSHDLLISKSDTRKYKTLTLKNQLQVLLIHDPEADKSAAALDVNIGCAMDPPPLYGMAHFCEHMLFMGTTKYPDEEEYSTYIKDKGGMNNAYTSLTNTNFHFDCSNEGLEGALDRFAQFFICPTFGESQAEREMNAVNSEYNMSLQSDDWRFFMLLQTLSHKDSKLHRFICGNLETLQQKGIREALLAFHKEWYSSNIMKLCISS